MSKMKQTAPDHSAYPEETLPAIIYFCINGTCNLRCKTCDFGFKQGAVSSFLSNVSANPNSELANNEIEDFLSTAQYFYPRISVTALEPLLSPKLWPLISYVKKNALKMEVTTNGTLLSRYAERIVRSGLDLLYVSLDGPKDVHDQIRGRKGSFHNAIRGIKNVLEIRGKLNVDTPHIKIATTLSAFNAAHLLDLVHVFLSLDIDGISFFHLDFISDEMASEHNKRFPQYPVKPNIFPIKECLIQDYRTYLHQVEAIKLMLLPFPISFHPELNEEQLAIYYTQPLTPISANRCRVPWTMMQITPGGHVVPMTRCADIVFGDIRKQSFDEIWFGEPMSRFREDLIKYGFFPMCTRCGGLKIQPVIRREQVSSQSYVSF